MKSVPALRHAGRQARGQPTRSMMVALAMPRLSHMVPGRYGIPLSFMWWTREDIQPAPDAPSG